MGRGENGRGTGRGESVIWDRRGVSVLELLLVLVLLGLLVGMAIPAYLSSRRDALSRECSIHLAVIREAKREVFEDMNRLLPPQRRLRITDPLNPLHVDRIAAITLQTPWRFHPEAPCPNGGEVTVGATFLDPPQCSDGTVAASLEKPTP